jgi:hypothetical protein
MSDEAPRDISYTLLKRDLGRLDREVVFWTGIKGHNGALLDDVKDSCRLFDSGLLHILQGFEWDFGSGPAVDTPVMVRASLAHDALCVLTDRGRVPWSVRRHADRYFRYLLIEYGCPRWLAWARYVAVRSYSMIVAHWRRTPYTP